MKLSTLRQKNGSHDPFEIFVSSISPHVSWILGGILFILFSICMPYLVAKVICDPEKKDVLKIERIPLTEDCLKEWCQVTYALAEQQERQKILVAACNLPELIEWGQNNPMLLKNSLNNTEPEIFLGIATAIEHARRNYRLQLEHELCIDDTYRIMEETDELADQINLSQLPGFEKWEMNDLNIYENHAILVEDALHYLFPTLPDLNSYWEEFEENQEESTGSDENPDVKKVAWRVINKAGLGPKVLRVK